MKQIGLQRQLRPTVGQNVEWSVMKFHHRVYCILRQTYVNKSSDKSSHAHVNVYSGVVSLSICKHRKMMYHKKTLRFGCDMYIQWSIQCHTRVGRLHFKHSKCRNVSGNLVHYFNLHKEICLLCSRCCWRWWLSTVRFPNYRKQCCRDVWQFSRHYGHLTLQSREILLRDFARVYYETYLILKQSPVPYFNTWLNWE